MATLFATAMLHLLACIPVARSQGLSQQCNTPAFANANATGYDSMVPLYAPVVPFADANVSTAILATDTQITQHFWFETPPLQPNNTVYISNNPSGGACLVLLDGFPNPNALRADLTAEKVFQGSRFCNSILSASCFEAIAEQSRADVNAAFKAGHFADPCAHVLQTAPAECNGTLAWTSSKGVSEFSRRSCRFVMRTAADRSQNTHIMTTSFRALQTVTGSFRLMEALRRAGFSRSPCLFPIRITWTLGRNAQTSS